jgi:hypothetical protein
MSEYQYYEFQAIDRPLTQEERAAICELSSRVKPTATSASFTYSYGNFRGDPKQVLARYFDIMYYITNWGTQQLMFRFPTSLIDREAIELYCIDDYISLSFVGDWAILDWEFSQEEGFNDWIEGQGKRILIIIDKMNLKAYHVKRCAIFNIGVGIRNIETIA